MNEISNIHAFEDEDFLHACFVWGMAVLGAFAVCLVPVFMLRLILICKKQYLLGEIMVKLQFRRF